MLSTHTTVIHACSCFLGDVPNMLLYENGNGKRGLNQFLMYALKSYTAMKLAVMMTRSNTESCNSDIS